MNGFIYWESEGHRLSPADLRRLAGPNDELQVDEHSFTEGDHLLVWGYASGDVQYRAQGRNTLVILSGYITEISNGPEILKQEQATEWLLKAIESDTSNAALSALLARLHGSFGIVYRDLKSGLLLCLTDRVSSRPLWKYRDGSGWIISSHPNVIAQAVPSIGLDPGALGAWMLYEGPVDPQKSIYAGVEAVGPGTILRLGESSSSQECRWYRFEHQPGRSMSVSSWVEFAHESLLRSAKRIARQCPRPAIFFSGGVDSRLVAAALQAAGADPLLVTLGDSRNVEVRVAEQAAHAMGLKQIVIKRDPRWYLRALPQAAFESGGGFLWVHGHFAEAIHTVRREHGVKEFILGDLCEAFSKLLCAPNLAGKGLWSTDEFVRNFDLVRMPEYQPKQRARTLSVLQPDLRREVEEALASDIRRRYESLAGMATDPRVFVDHFSRWDSVATISTFFMFLDVRGAGAERNLMFDPDAHSLLEQLPANIRDGRNLGAKLVRSFNAKAGRVVNSNSMLPICWPPMAHRMSKKAKPYFGKIRRLIQGRNHLTAGAWPEKAALYGTDSHWRGHFEQVLTDESSFESGLFDRQRIGASWHEFLGGDRTLAKDLEKLVQFGMLNSLRHSDAEPVAAPIGCA